MIASPDHPHRLLFVLDANRRVVPAVLAEWSRFLSLSKEREVGYFHEGDLEISTCFIGIDMSHRRNGTPIVFESIVWKGDLVIDQQRYATWTDAERGHKALVSFYNRGGE